MIVNKSCTGRALRIAVGITALVLVMAGGAGAVLIVDNCDEGARIRSSAINNLSVGISSISSTQ